MGIRNKLLIIIAGALVLSLYISTYLQINSYNKAFEAELDKRIDLLQQNLNQRALAQAHNLSSSLAENIASFNLFSLSQLIQEAVESSPELSQVVLVAKDGRIFVHSSNPKQHQQTYTPRQTGEHKSIQLETPKNISVRAIHESKTSSDSESILEYRVPINIGEINWGEIYLEYSMAQLNKSIANSYEEHTLLQEEQMTKAKYSAAIILLVAFVLIAQLAERLVDPLVRLSSYAKEIAKGNFTKVYRFQSTGKDEVAELSRNFVEMARNLEESYLEQAHYNLTLETKVTERTKELNTKNEELIKAFKKVEESQQQLVYSEKMAALGQLIAGIAHEINTPLGAIGASASNTSHSLQDHLIQLKPILETSTDPIASTLIKLLTLISETPNIPYEALSTREERNIKRSLTQKLNAHHDEGSAQSLAEMILEMGLHENFEALRPEIEHSENNKAITLAHSLMSIQRNNSTIHTAISRVSKIVFALKNFSHQDSSGEMVRGDINEGIDTVLVLYQNQFKQGCDVHKDLGELPSTLCYPDELNQVWTNLIHNALQAMDNLGTLSISTQYDQGNIVVKISDSGPGIPEEIQDKIFSSFFTTKPAGEGTGLGLSICKTIVDKHQGKLYLDSKPGHTTFTVSIPVRS